MSHQDSAATQPTDVDRPPLLLTTSDDGAIATITLNRPAARNAISRQLARDLAAVLHDLSEGPAVRAVILTGAGERAFCAGADLVERRTMTPAERTAHTAEITAAADALAALPVPVIAAIRGYALAGGAELALACDLRVAGTDAILGFPEVRVGIFPGAGGVFRLPRLIGDGAARDLLYTGRQIDAVEAVRLGLVDRMVDPADVRSTTSELAITIAAAAPLAVRALKRALTDSTGLPAPEAARAIERHRRPLDATADYAEGLAAFAESRPPAFRGQ